MRKRNNRRYTITVVATITVAIVLKSKFLTSSLVFNCSLLERTDTDIRLTFSSAFSSLIGNTLVFVLVISHPRPWSYHNDYVSTA
jgi:hypothetical protein